MGVEEPLVREERDGAVIVLELNRPDAMNSLTSEMVAALHDALRAADADPDVRAVVLTGSGRAFCAGMDVSSKLDEPETAEEVIHHWYERDKATTDNLLMVMEMSTPVVAAVNGWCLGGGFWYALACDITIAAESAVFGQPEVRHVSNSTFLFAALAGWKNAHRYALTGDHFDAAEALRIGVVNEVVPDDQLMARALSLAHRLARVPRASIRLNKAITNLGLQVAGMRAGMTFNAALSAMAHASMDSAEVAELRSARQAGDLRQFLKLRDDPFRPEPGGPRSK